jgi:hypothetical protein
VAGELFCFRKSRSYKLAVRVLPGDSGKPEELLAKLPALIP